MKRSIVKKWLACLLALCTLLALCACGKTSSPTPKDDPQPAPRDPKAVMEEAAEKMKDIRSISFDMDLQMAMSVEEQSVDVSMTVTAETVVDPMVVHGTMRMDAAGMDAEIYAVQQDDAWVTYTGQKEGGKVRWTRTTVSADDLEAIQAQIGTYDAQGSFSTQLDVTDNLKEIGVETVNGKNATRYDGVIHGKDIGKALGQTSVAETMEMLGIDPAKLDQDAPISIWIYEDGMPAKYEIDMAAMMAQLFSQNEQTAQIEISAARMSMTVTGVNNVDGIVIPQEALDAAEASGGGDPGNENPPEGDGAVFTSNGMTITLTEDFIEDSAAGFTACFLSDQAGVLAQREPFTLMEGVEDYTVEQYGQMVLENNGMDVSMLTSFDGIPGFEYDYPNGDLHYRIFLFKADDAFWMVEFFTLKDDFAALEPQINQWAQTVTFED